MIVFSTRRRRWRRKILKILSKLSKKDDDQLSARERDMLRFTAESLGLSKGQVEMIEKQFVST